MRTFFRFLANHRLFTTINILGFSLSLSFIILLGDLIYRETSTESFQTRGDRIYVVGNELFQSNNFRTGHFLAEKFPEVEDWCALGGYSMSFVKDGIEIDTKVMLGRENFFEFFDYDLEVGNKATVLNEVNNVVITRSFADKYFNGQDPIGQQLVVANDNTDDNGDKFVFTISGIMRDIELSTIPSEYECIINIENLKYIHSSAYNENMGNAASSMVYLLEREGSDLKAHCGDMADYLKTFFWIYQDGVVKDVVLTPLNKLYYEWNGAGFNGNEFNHGNIYMTFLYITIGLCILIFAVFNYINLSVTLATDRSKEMATRRLLGSQSHGIFLRLMSESIVFTTIAFAIGFVVAAGLQDAAGQLVNCHLNIFRDFVWWHYTLIIFGIISVGIMAGIVPSSILSNYKPIDIVKGTFRNSARQHWSHVLMVIQTVFTIIMLTTVMMLGDNISEKLSQPVGFNYNNIMEVYGPLQGLEQRRVFRDKMMEMPEVESVGMGYGTPLNFLENNTMNAEDGTTISTRWLMGDSAMFNMLDIHAIETYQDDDIYHNIVSVNKYMLTLLKLPEDAREITLYSGQNANRYTIASLYPDFVYQNVLSSEANAPMMIFRFDEAKDDNPLFNWYGYPRAMYIKYSPRTDVVALDKKIGTVMQEITGHTGYESTILTDQHKMWFAKYERFKTVLIVFTVVAFIISILGLLAMNSYFIANRKREIAVRKVLGSTTNAIIIKLMRIIMIQFALAVIIALPLSIWLAPKVATLSGMSVEMNYMPFVTATFVVAAVIGTTIWLQAHRAASENPIKNIKTE